MSVRDNMNPYVVQWYEDADWGFKWVTYSSHRNMREAKQDYDALIEKQLAKRAAGKRYWKRIRIVKKAIQVTYLDITEISI